MTIASYRPKGIQPLIDIGHKAAQSIRRLGHMLAFFVEAITSIPITLRYYSKEFFRLLADVTWGNGSLVTGGGTVGVAAVLGAVIGALIGIEAYNLLNIIGLGPATGFISSFVATRELAPIMAALAFAMQAGCRFTAQLGAQRINEEIDALDALAIRPSPYLVTTRLLAATVAVVPLYLLCLVISYIMCRLLVGISSGGLIGGSYDHYFTMSLAGSDIFYSVLKAVIFVWIASTIQCYFGFNASGGPEGVGVAAGHAMRAAITIVIIVNMLLTMALWGVDAGARFGG